LVDLARSLPAAAERLQPNNYQQRPAIYTHVPAARQITAEFERKLQQLSAIWKSTVRVSVSLHFQNINSNLLLPLFLCCQEIKSA